MTTNQPNQPAAKRGADRLTDGVLVCIVLLVGVMAGAASFTHVHDWTLHNSPADTKDWFGWGNAVITELIPMAALIVIARRRRTGASIGYPLFLLVVAVGVSLTAQLAVAVPTVFGWLVSALPALAFFALSKLVFSVSRPHNTESLAPAPATIAPAPPISGTAPATVSPAASQPTATIVEPEPVTTANTSTDHRETTPVQQPAEPEPSPQTAPATVPALPARPSVDLDIRDLLPGARVMATAHQRATGEPITANQLAARMKVPTTFARDLLAHLTDQPALTHTHNGAPVTANQ